MAMGPVLTANHRLHNSSSPDSTSPLGSEGDFGVFQALRKIPQNLPLQNLRSICRYLTSELSRASTRHRTEPGAPMPDLPLIVKTMSEDVFNKRFQDYRFAVQVEARHAELAERVKALETRHSQSGSSSTQNNKGSTKSSTSTSSGEAKAKGKSKWGPKPDTSAASSTTSADQGSEAVKLAASIAQKLSKNAASAQADSTRSSSTQQSPPSAAASKPAGQAVTATGAEDTISHKMVAIKALQVAVRSRLGLPTHRNNFDKEPCAWKALVGVCSKQDCKNCAGQVAMPADLLAEVKAKCLPGILGKAASSSGSA